MLTARGWWLVLLAALLTASAVLWPGDSQTLVATLGLSLLLWFGWEWFWFTAGVRITASSLRLERELRDERGPVTALWVGRSVEVALQLSTEVRPGLAWVVAADFVPFAADVTAGSPVGAGPVGPGRPLQWSYRLRCRAVGRVRFEGVRLRFADPQGFFRYETFLPALDQRRVVPPLVDTRGRTPVVKRYNLLPPPGLHRHRRPGSGAELLDLRDYRPGDPPKMIAWKVSARRGRLITRELESDVPVRCTLLVDTSNSVRVGGPGHNALGQIVEIAAAVVQGAAANRDLVGLVLVDEDGFRATRPARGSRHVADLLNQLTDAAAMPATPPVGVAVLLPPAMALARELYPQWLRPDRNAFPFWLPWLRPRPAAAVPRPTWRDRWYGFLPWLLVAWFGLVCVALAMVLGTITRLLHASGRGGQSALVMVLALGLLLTLVLLVFLPRDLFFAAHRREYRERKLLAALVSVQQGLAPGGLELMLEDDACLAAALQRFLADHQVPYAAPFYDDQGRYLFAAPGKVAVAARALLHALSRQRDNELFVLLLDLLEIDDPAPLLQTVRVALARHHRAVVVCPWPPGVPTPDKSVTLPAAESPGGPSTKLLMELRLLTTIRFHRAFARLREAFGRLGVPVVCAAQGKPATLVLKQLEELRHAGRPR
ncbi:MAG: DUF58 domain-containing protein [Gemmataceae bacterium]|nr:DUF58 domain-containing protein [Gemmataceae bacterium]MDW8264233.1 DUF58 domain-containing protein [Gemmataceae bacterium]